MPVPVPVPAPPPVPGPSDVLLSASCPRGHPAAVTSPAAMVFAGMFSSCPGFGSSFGFSSGWRQFGRLHHRHRHLVPAGQAPPSAAVPRRPVAAAAAAAARARLVEPDDVPSKGKFWISSGVQRLGRVADDQHRQHEERRVRERWTRTAPLAARCATARRGRARRRGCWSSSAPRRARRTPTAPRPSCCPSRS